MNITVFLLKKFIVILYFSFFMCSNLGLFAQTWKIIKSLIFTSKSIISNTFILQKCKHAHIL